MGIEKIRTKFENEIYHYPLKGLNKKELKVLAAFDECMELYGGRVRPAPGPASPEPFKTYMMKYECLNNKDNWQAFMTYKFFPIYRNRRGQIMVETFSNLTETRTKGWDDFWLDDIDLRGFREAFQRTLLAFNRVTNLSEKLKSYDRYIKAILLKHIGNTVVKKNLKPEKNQLGKKQVSVYSRYQDEFRETTMELPRLYGDIMSCHERCQGIIRDDHTNIPRGFFTQAILGDPIKAFLVAQNPGQPMKDHGEWQLYKGLLPDDAVNAHLGFGRSCFFGGQGKPFHKRLISWISDLLEIPQSEVFKSVVYSNVVKCTTPKNKAPHRTLVMKCARLHLQREIALWKPKVVIAQGTNARRCMQWCGIVHEFLPHPSHRKQADYHKQFFEKIKKTLMRKE